MHFQDVGVVGCIFAIVTHIVNCGIDFQSISVHPRFDTEYYDHIYSCHYCTRDTQQANLIWQIGQSSLGGFVTSHTRGRVFSRGQTVGSTKFANASIFLITGSLNGIECLSSLLIIGSNNATLSPSPGTCNGMLTSGTELHDTINRTQSEDGNVKMDYVFARNDVTDAYSLSYHGITCRTSQSDRQMWHVNGHMFELRSNELGKANLNDADGMGYAVVSVSVSTSEIISFLSVSSIPPSISTVVVSCSNTNSSVSMHLLNISTSAAITEARTTNIVSSTSVITTAPFSDRDLNFSMPPVIVTENIAPPLDSLSIIAISITVGVFILLLFFIVVIGTCICMCNSSNCFRRSIVTKGLRKADSADGNYYFPMTKSGSNQGDDEPDGVMCTSDTNRHQIPENIKIRKQWSLEEGEDTGFLYCTFKKEYY